MTTGVDGHYICIFSLELLEDLAHQFICEMWINSIFECKSQQISPCRSKSSALSTSSSWTMRIFSSPSIFFKSSSLDSERLFLLVDEETIDSTGSSTEFKKVLSSIFRKFSKHLLVLHWLKSSTESLFSIKTTVLVFSFDCDWIKVKNSSPPKCWSAGKKEILQI